MRKEFQDILTAVQAGREADLVRTVNGQPVVRRFLPPERLVLLGGGHVSLALYEAARKVGFAVSVADDRPAFASYTRFPEAREVVCDSFENALPRLHIGAGDFVCVLTRGHKDDVTCMKYLLQGNEPRYLGMIGSHRRVKGLFDLLAEEGFDRDRISRVHAPIGLSIGAVTPAEIAVSILAELIAVRHTLPAGEGVLPQQNTDLDALRFLADDSRVGRGNWLAGASSHARATWSGLAFERLCLQHVPQIKRALGIAGVSTAVHAARIPPGPDGEPGAQIDLVLDRADGIANLCEMKYSSDLFAVSSKYRSELLAKVSAYQRAFGARKTVHVTLVTATGLRPNENADVVQSEVRLADLFADA